MQEIERFRGASGPIRLEKGMNLVWNLTPEDVASLLRLDANISIAVIEPSRPFGGYTGEKALIKIEPRHKPPYYVLLKRTQLTWAKQEVEAYQALTSVGAPVVTCYGFHPLSKDRGVVAVEYLPHALDWPISPERHLAWAAASAAFARCPVPKEVELPHIAFLPECDTILAGLEAATQASDPELRAGLAQVNPHRVLARVEDVLTSFLKEVDALPRGLTHGECYPMHMGQRTPDGPVLFFDVISTAVRPRFFDVQGLIVDHGEPYEISDTTRVLQVFRKAFDPSMPWDVFRREVALIEGLVALRTVGLQLRLLRQGRGEAWQDKREAVSGHIKWIRLSLTRADQVLRELAY